MTKLEGRKGRTLGGYLGTMEVGLQESEGWWPGLFGKGRMDWVEAAADLIGMHVQSSRANSIAQRTTKILCFLAGSEPGHAEKVVKPR